MVSVFVIIYYIWWEMIIMRVYLGVIGKLFFYEKRFVFLKIFS